MTPDQQNAVRAAVEAIVPINHAYFLLFTPKGDSAKKSPSTFMTNAPVGEWPTILRQIADGIEGKK